MQSNSIVITGASSGIGAALARQLAEPGRTIALLGRDRQRLSMIADECRGKGAVCEPASIDVCDRQGMTTFLGDYERRHGVDLIISNAGIFHGRRANQVVESADDAQRILTTNMMAAIDAVHMVLPGMRERQHGDIVFMASLSALSPLADAPAYSASKAGVMSYGLALREAVRKEGIRVVVACPGYVATPAIAKHRGLRLGEVSPEAAARRVLKGLNRNRALIGFPVGLFWLSRAALLAPEFVRRATMEFFRFHME